MGSSSTTLAVRSGSKDGGERRTKELGEDDILEILARLPVKSLLRFKSVSKTWYSLIISPNFISIHYAHSLRKNKVSLLLYSCTSKKKSFPGMLVRNTRTRTTASFGIGDVTVQLAFRGRYQFEIVDCVNGVVCLSLSQCPQMYALWNPSTRQCREIGPPIDRTDLDFFLLVGDLYGSGFCYDPVTNAFKVARIKLTVTEAGETTAQVHVFSTDTNSWTAKNMHVPFPIKSGGHTKCATTCVNGYVYWHIARLQDNGTMDFELEEMYILRYNISDEVFQRIEMPFPPAFVYYHLVAYEGSLTMFVRNETGSDNSYDEFDVWVLNDCGSGNHSWYKLLTCKPSIKVGFAIGFFRKDDVDLVLFREEPDRDLYLYDHEKGETKKFGKEACGTQTFLYSESLVSFN